MTINYLQYWQNGLAVIPELQGKPMRGIKWSGIYKNEWSPSSDQIRSWNRLNEMYIGLITGQPSSIVGIDIDTNDIDLVRAIEQLLPNSPCRKYGTKGYTAFYAYNGESNNIWKHKGEVICELLSTGRKTTIPPSLNKNGQPYIWMEEPLLDCAVRLPSLPDDFLTQMDHLFPKEIKRRAPVLKYHSHNTEISLSDAETMLRYCDPDMSYFEWVSIGMALRSYFGDEAFSLFYEWSSQGTKYNGHEMWPKWHSFNSPGYTIATLIHYATIGGYSCYSNYVEASDG